MSRRPTILDVAARAGVSKSTVSLVLQNSAQVKAETREAVRAAMAEIGYVYNRAAAQMRSQTAGLVGLVINDLRNPFFTEFATVLQMTLAAKGYATVIANSDEDPDLQAKLIGSMIEHGVSALVVSPAYDDAGDAFDQIARAGIPAMQVLRKTDPRTGLFPFASFDYAAGSALATRHLLDQGAKRIAFVGGMEGRAITEERKSGYLAELKRAGIAPFTHHGRSSRAFGVEAVNNLPDDVDAAVCFNDLVALGMLSGFARAGVELGRDFRLVGFDDIEDCAQVWPLVSSIGCDIESFAQDVADGLLAWMQTGETPPPEHRAPVELIARTSSTGTID
ncbi:LacI family DNA-binding transcriptional regulator [Gymnodinialimonas ceratoperidinii]|uniref:LacI family transcriptional regulator n=1 Tax=Gymnodinialimonas ceratoperidinii TaxID=2856823 RepID=A0A8F6TXL5_9RHOB|nr:LacI family DNA-binding transcriptional regulator [Gymnodinialimonas ceratoperidinii]QXT40318.1 LacI family transcriptional regulator [Gymnodinialimonas ceratoperidinii]